jgi:guanylate kinase
MMLSRNDAHTTTAARAGATDAASTASSSTDDALRDVQERLGVTLSEEPTVPPPHPAVIVISGPSGVGKDAVIRRLQELRPELHMVVTATSRGMRPREVDGVDYFFVSTAEFEEMIEQGELIEHAVVYGEYKGIPKQQVREKLAMRTDVVLRLDVQGAATVRGLIPGAVFIFLVAESEASLARRLVARKTETPDKLALRVQTAREETARVSEFDYVVVNADGKLDETAGKLAAIIDVEKMKRGRERVKL